ncbi:putative signal transduction histidine-protein kinase [Podospora australis]|uniref:Signal transduction histidine-protein kinase n=1 Tax=Podospora australis TaxID=1536484 RepID=A0AAN6WXA2_9PEZI|nr:putative signal transduction histidine-protein kinase [Podospora australis]
MDPAKTANSTPADGQKEPLHLDLEKVTEFRAGGDGSGKGDGNSGSSETSTTIADTGASFPPDATSPTCLSSWSTFEDRQLGHPSNIQDHTDRVFPIRSVISVDPAGRKSVEHDTKQRRLSLSDPPHGTPLDSGNTQQQVSLSEIGPGSNPRHTLRGHAGSMPSPSPACAPSPGVRARQRRMHAVTGSLSSIQADAERQNAVPLILAGSSDEESDSAPDQETEPILTSPRESAELDPISESLFTPRFKHVITEEGHAVITGRDGKLQRCEDEPIHTPGAVQGFGLMLALREEADGRFEVRYVSENSQKIIGYTPQELFQLNDFLDILSDEQADNLLDHIDFIRDEDADPTINGPEVFSLALRPQGHDRSIKLWSAIHLNQAHPDLIICEFELDDDRENPLRPAEEDTHNLPEDTLQSNPTTEELTESTEILSKPLRVLRSARKRRGEAGAMQVFDIMSQVQEQLANAPNLEKFLKILVGIVKELTGFHRVMIYQFDSAFNGKVVTELVDPSLTRDLYKGLHFPASDIPKQARELYKINKVRLLYDRDLETARIVCRSTEDLETPLDMTHSYLRAMSPIHLKYLANMAVRSSMSISINAFGDLWGLIACHSYGPKGMRVSFPIRKMCRLVGDTVSRNIERLSYASRLQARKLINTVPTEHNPSGYIIASSDDLLKLFDADFGMLSIREETKILGKIEHSQEALAMLEYLRLRKFTSVLTTQDVKTDFPDLHYPPGFKVIAGLLYVPLSVGGNDFIIFFRKGQVREVKWAGNPYEKIITEGTDEYLQPRKSFRVWHETVLGKSREWSEEQVETAAVLCLVYGKFIEVWRQKEAALQSSRLTRLLLANSAHEVRTPLNAIINYLEIALEGSLDQETRDNLARSHSASKSLIYVINDLLDLTKTEEGQELVKDEMFDLPACIREGTEPFKNDAKRKGINYEIIEHPGLPRFVYGDQRRVRQAVANVTANAVQHTSTGFVRVEMYLAEVQDRRVRIEIVVQDSGAGMSDAQLDVLFRDLEQVSSESDDNNNPILEQEDKPREQRTLGLGLAVVARILRNMDGQLRLKSELGKGSRFVIQLPFELPPDDEEGSEERPTSYPSSVATSKVESATFPAPISQQGEVIVVSRGSISSGGNSVYELSPKKSFDETQSISSHRSMTSKGSARSVMSDAERLIDAIQTPFALGEPEPEMVARQRRSSRGAYYNPGSAGSEVKTTRSLSPADRIRPSGAPRSGSSPTQRNTTPSLHSEPNAPTGGLQYVTDTKTPIKPVKIPDEYTDLPPRPQPSETSRVLFEIPDTDDKSTVASKNHCQSRSVATSGRPSMTSQNQSQNPSAATSGRPSVSVPGIAKLGVLVAEDDPINVKVLRKRLEKAGHHVSHALNGEDCATMYGEKPTGFDVVLMDMQMPIVDGLSSTKMIRAFEKSDKSPGLSSLAASHGRIPIIAVSASLVEREKDTYVDAGFDGWILKPIDFKRLETLLQGIVDDNIRNDALYVPGEWERGGWFRPRAEYTPPRSEQSAEDAVEEEPTPTAETCA